MGTESELQTIVKSLIEAGFSEKYLAEKVGCSQPTIHRIKKGGTDPSYTIGVALKKLYAEYIKAA